MKGIIHLNSSFSYKGCEEIPYKLLKFPGGESHVQIDETAYQYDTVVISARIHNGDHLMQIALLKDALDRMDTPRIELVLPYLPYARQDRVANTGESLSLKVIANMINAMNFASVTVFDVHSDVATALINKCRSLSPFYFVSNIARDLIKFHVVFPDAGAAKKYYSISREYNQLPAIICSKHRDTETGKLDGFNLDIDQIRAEDCLIVDDICDGGRTFIEIAKRLKSRGASKVYLYVTHGIFSNGISEILSVIDGIYCTNSYADMYPKKVSNFKQFKLSL